MTTATAITTQDRIRDTYFKLAGGTGVWIGLAELREAMPDVPRADMDKGLRMINREEGVVVYPESNQKALTKEDREAAVVIGDQEKHLIRIDQ